MQRSLEKLAGVAAGCTKCRLASGRTTVVFGSGRADADLMFIGEAPGFHEDKQGIPFVGAAGQLLNTVLESIGLSREDVYIANTLKCRPPGNRDPMPDEVESCKPYLLEQVDLVDPRVICTLGNFATQLLLERKVGITKVRGQRFSWRGRVLLPTFHPAAVLHGGGRASDQMHQLEQDFKTLRQILDETAVASEAAPDDSEQLGLF